MDLGIKNSDQSNNDKLRDNLRTSIRLIQVAHDLADVYTAVRIVIDLPEAESKSEMRQYLAKLAASFLVKDFGEEMMDYKATFIVELAEKIAELPDEEFV